MRVKEIWGDLGRFGEIWGDLGRSGEIWGDRPHLGALRHAARGERRVEESSQLRVLARDGEGEPLCGGAGVQRPRAGHVLQTTELSLIFEA